MRHTWNLFSLNRAFHSELRIAYFVSSHGLGHATRTAAIISQLATTFNSVKVQIFSQTPSWFWCANLPDNCNIQLINEVTDVGLVQKGPFNHCINETLTEVSKLLSFTDLQLKKSSSFLLSKDPHLILCDISPLGVELGDRLQIPTIIIENFTWDWIYQDYLGDYPQFQTIIDLLKSIYNKAALRIQCRPLCKSIEGSPSVNPIFRSSKMDKPTVHEKLGLHPEQEYVILSTGGMPMKHQFVQKSDDFYIVVPGNYESIHRQNNIIFLPMNWDISFIDLISASSRVVGKAGYGTVSECWGLDVPFAGVFRNSFPESKVLRNFCQNNLVFEEVDYEKFAGGYWLEYCNALPIKKRKNRQTDNGAIQAVNTIMNFADKRNLRI